MWNRGFLYSLTLEELQKHLGRPVATMSLHELIVSLQILDTDDNGFDSNFLHQYSTIYLSGSVISKTVDEVRREIEEDHDTAASGEITLEDLLVKAGIDLDPPYTATQMSMSSSPSENQTIRRRNSVAPLQVIVEKRYEKRQKRLIKNRESAARYRARKQVYNDELEIRKAHLEIENERLKRQQGWGKKPWPDLQFKRSRSAPI